MPGLVDYLGRPVKTSSLTKEVATVTVGSVRSAWHEQVSSTLTPQRLATIIAEVDKGDLLSYLTLAEEMEENDLHYRSVISTRKKAVSGLEAVVEAHSDDSADVEIADATREMIEDDAFGMLRPILLDAIAKSFSVSETIWERGSMFWPKEYRFVDQRHFMFDRETGSELRLRDSSDPFGIPLEPFKFCVHRPQTKMGLTMRGGLARAACVAYVFKAYSIKDWMAFAEVFGMPLRLGKYGEGANDEDKATLFRAVTNIGSDAAAIIPESMEIEFIEAFKAAGGDKLFESLANFFDNQVSKGVLGQTASTEGTAGRLGSDEAQENVRDDIIRDDAAQLATTLRRDLVKPFVDLNFGELGRGKYPRLTLFIEEPEDLESLSRTLAPLVDRGLRVPTGAILDKIGLPEAGENEEILKPLGGGVNAPPAGDDGDADDTGPNDIDNAVAHILGMVRRGEKLTGDQRALLASSVSAATLASRDPQDEIDRLTDAAATSGWRKIMNPIFQPVLDLAKASDGYTDFLDGLERVLSNVDSTEFAKQLATANFKARGLGDGTDEP